MRRDSSLAVVDWVGDESVPYDVVLLAGSPRLLTLRLSADIAEGSVIEVGGELWTVADVRPDHEAHPQLICIYPV